MYIGIGTVVVIVIIVLVILMLRRSLCFAAAPTRLVCILINLLPIAVATLAFYIVCGARGEPRAP